MADKIMTFESVHQTLKAEKVLRLAGLKTTAINTPRRISSDCGISLKFDVADEPDMIARVKEAGITYRGVYEYK